MIPYHHRPKFSVRPHNFRLVQDHPLVQGLVFGAMNNKVQDDSIGNAPVTQSGAVKALLANRPAYAFDRPDYLNVENRDFQDPRGGLTLCAWVYPTAIDAYNLIIGRETPGIAPPYQYHALFLGGATQSSGLITTAVTINNNRYLDEHQTFTDLRFTISHIAFTYSESNITARVFLNGLQIHSYTAEAGSITTTDEPIRVAASKTFSTEQFEGRIADALMYNRALTASEVRQHADLNNFMLDGAIEPVPTQTYFLPLEAPTPTVITDIFQSAIIGD